MATFEDFMRELQKAINSQPKKKKKEEENDSVMDFLYRAINQDDDIAPTIGGGGRSFTTTEGTKWDDKASSLLDRQKILDSEAEKVRKKEKDIDKKDVEHGGSSVGFSEEALKKRAKEKEEEKKDLFGLDLFQKGALGNIDLGKHFEDGWQFGDILKTGYDTNLNISKAILGTAGDTGVELVRGFGNFTEGIADAIGYTAADLLQSDFVTDTLGLDTYGYGAGVRGRTEQEIFNDMLAPLDKKVEKWSVLGDSTDAVASGVGQVGTMAATGVALGGAGVGAKAVSGITKALQGLSSYGHGYGEAIKDGANYAEARGYGLLSAGAEVIGEMLFSNMGKLAKNAGVDIGVFDFDDVIAKKVGSLISSPTWRNAAMGAVKGVGEGIEEWFTGVLQGAAKKATYMKDEDIFEIWNDENLWEQFFVGMLTGEVVQGNDVYKANKSGRDLITGRNADEQTVLDKMVEEEMAKAEKDGKKVKKGDIEADISEKLEKGFISVDDIERILGGDSYNAYASAKEKFMSTDLFKELHNAGVEDQKLNDEFEALKGIKREDSTLGDEIRIGEIQKRMEELKARSEEIRAQLKPGADNLNSMLGKVRNEVSERVKDGKLAESYRELLRSTQKFQADPSKYKSEAAKKTIQNLVDGGIANNTNEFREFAELMAKISDDKGAVFDITDNKRLKGTRFAIQGATTNAFVTEDGNITINKDSKKRLNALVGHEITHVLEGTEFYTELQEAVKKYAQTKGEWDSRLKSVTDLYKKYKPDADPTKELTADLIGEYIFNDRDFVMNLSTSKNAFRKVFDEVKYLAKIATAGSKEARQLEKAKKVFEEVWKSTSKKPTKTEHSLSEIVDDNNHSYGIGVHLDSTLLDGLSPDERLEMVKEYVKELGGESFTAYDSNGNAVDITIAEPKEKFKNHNGKKVYATKDLTTKHIGNEVKQEAIALVDELVVAAEYDTSKAPRYPHGWLDNNGQNDWDYWTTYIQDKNNTIWEATLNIANSADGRKVLYDIGPIKKVGRAVKSATISTTNNIPQNIPVVNDQFSLSDSDGNQLTDAQAEFFKDSVVRDETGNLKVMYHGTSRGGFNVFDTYGSNHGLFGVGSYFTDSKAIGESYTKKGKGSNPQVYEAYLNIKNPMDMDAQANPEEWAKAFPDADFPESGTNEQFYRAVEEFYADQWMPKWEVADEIQSTLESGMGYDGITHIGGGRVNADGERHRVYIAFNPEQIKNIDNQNPTSDPDIRYSISEDSDGNQLTDEQSNFFADSKVVDENGSLLVMYHGTPNGSIAEFKPGTYFTANKEYADRYQNPGASSISSGKVASNPKTFAVYLNIKKPFDINDAEARRIYIEDYIKGGNALGINPYLSDAEYANINSIDWTEGEDLRDFLLENGYDYDGLILDEGGDGGYGEAVNHRGKSYMIFTPEQAKSIDNQKPTSDSRMQYSLSEDSDVDYGHIMEMQVEVNKLTNEIAEFERTEEFKAKMQEFFATEDVDKGIQAYIAWREESGYDALIAKRDSLKSKLEEARKRFDDYNSKQAEIEEKDAIAKSGLSEADYFRKQAVKEFGYTPYFYDAGYLTPNGKMLNFSGEKGRHFGSRGQDHRAIGVIYETTQGSEAMVRFMNDGNIRIMAETPGLDISASVEPTKEQYASIRKFIRESSGEGFFAVDISDADGRNIGTYQYNGRVFADRVVNDIKHFFQTGKMRESSGLTDFLSISKSGDAQRSGTGYGVHGDKIGIRSTTGFDPFADIGPIGENVMPVAQNVQPVMENPFPDTLDSAQTELDNLLQQREALESRMLEAVNTEDFEAFNQINAEYESVMARIGELEGEIAESESGRIGSLSDADVPPVMDAPYDESPTMQTPNPFYERDMKEVGNRKVKAYMYENPEVKPFFQEAALGMLGDLHESVRGEKWYNDDVYYESGGEKGWGGTKRQTTEDIADLLDNWGYTYADIEKGLNAIIEDDGAENNACSKRIEFMLHDRLVNGHKSVWGEPFPPNQEYIDLLKEKQINEYSEEAFNSFMESADQYAPPVEDFGPVANTQTAYALSPADDVGPVVTPAVEDNIPYAELDIPMAELDIPYAELEAPVKEEYEAIRPRPRKQPKMVETPAQDIGPVYGEKLVRVDSSPYGERRRWIDTSTQSDAVDGKILPEGLDQELIHYQPISNKKTLGNANAMLENMGYEESVQYLNGQFKNNKVKLDDIALGERLIQEAIKRGDTKTAGDLIMDISILGTELGQKVQALSIIKRLTPEGQLRMLQRTIERGKAKKDPAFDGVELKQEHKDNILKSRNKDGSYDQKKLNKAVEDAKQDLADQMKVTGMDVANAWRYLAMLGNPKTHLRNIVSNVAMSGTVAVKNAVARTAETVVDAGAKVFGKKINRTKTWRPATDDVVEFAKQTAIDMKDVIAGDSKYSDAESIKDLRKIFSKSWGGIGKVVDALSNFNSDAMSAEDSWFSRPAFRSALREYLTANGIRTNEDIQKNTKIVEQAKQYALEQSLIATFRQRSWLATKLNEMERKNIGTQVALGSVIPFKKTPINVAKAGLNYSPVGFLKTLTYDAHQVKKGNMEASELIDHLAQNFTGTALTLLGYALAQGGLLNGGGEDDKEGKYDYQLGEQSYSITIDGNTYSLNWLSPVAMPLFVGANMYEQLVEDKEWNGNVVVETLAKTLDPLSEMSFVSSLNDVLTSYGSGTEKIAGVLESGLQNYITQYVPTFTSQIAATMDDTKRSTKASKDSDFRFLEETLNQIKYKIPGFRQTLEPTLDIWGNEVKQNENLGARAVESFIAPWSTRNGISTEVDEEIKRLYSRVGENGVLPGTPDGYIVYKNDKYNMSAKEYTAFKKAYGQLAYDTLEELFDTNTYRKATSREKAALVEDVYEYARDEAKRGILKGRNVEFTNATKDGKAYYKENAIVGAIENDMTPEEYTYSQENPEKYDFLTSNGITYKQFKGFDKDTKDAYDWAFDNQEKYQIAEVVYGDFPTYYERKKVMDEFDAKDEYGNTVNGLKKERIFDYINSLPLDDGEKMIMFKTYYKTNDDYNYEIIDYLNNRDDISYEEMNAILIELGFKIGADGRTVTWD